MSWVRIFTRGNNTYFYYLIRQSTMFKCVLEAAQRCSTCWFVDKQQPSASVAFREKSLGKQTISSNPQKTIVSIRAARRQTDAVVSACSCLPLSLFIWSNCFHFHHTGTHLRSRFTRHHLLLLLLLPLLPPRRAFMSFNGSVTIKAPNHERHDTKTLLPKDVWTLR